MIKLKKFEDQQKTMPLKDILIFAKYGYICYQLHKKENKEFIQTLTKK